MSPYDTHDWVTVDIGCSVCQRCKRWVSSAFILNHWPDINTCDEQLVIDVTNKLLEGALNDSQRNT